VSLAPCSRGNFRVECLQMATQCRIVAAQGPGTWPSFSSSAGRSLAAMARSLAAMILKTSTVPTSEALNASSPGAPSQHGVAAQRSSAPHESRALSQACHSQASRLTVLEHDQHSRRAGQLCNNMRLRISIGKPNFVLPNLDSVNHCSSKEINWYNG